MSTIPTLKGITSQIVQTDRLKVHILTAGPAGGAPVLFIHGNGASATFWEETMLALPPGFRGIAPDMRGYGDTEPLPVDATLGLSDMVEDIRSLARAMGLGRHHIVGHSMGGGIVIKYAIAYSADLLSITLVDTMSPYGYSGSKGLDGAPCYDDGAPAGAGSVNPDFIRLMGAKDRGAENPSSPRNVLRQFYVKPPFIPKREEELLSSMLSLRVGEDWYPGDLLASSHWPGVAPGKRGLVNAFSRRYFDASAIVDIQPKPPILWIRGADDLIVSNSAFWDIAALGAMGYVPGWPGADECPAQPMLDQIRAVLDRYQANGGSCREAVIADAGHSPFLEKPDEFNALLAEHLQMAQP
ncbi:MAG: alpha/beta fold hydrolase [Anaerolineae bacterium]|nr:alpha/beta fold hydrolase [Anaerolineae bacterium]